MAIQQFKEDELDDLKVSPATQAAVAADTYKAAAEAKSVPAGDETNISCWDVDDESAKDVLKASGLPFVKVSENQPARIAFIPRSKMVGAPTHYSEAEKCYYICASTKEKLSKCCDRFGDPKGRACAFVFQYTNCDPKTGKYTGDTLPTVEIGIFTMSPTNWQDVKGGPEEGQSVYDCDFNIAVQDKQLARKISVISRQARWSMIKDAALELAAPFLANPNMLVKALGRRYNVGYTDATMADVNEL